MLFGCLQLKTGMNKTLFLAVWDIYQAYWGQYEQAYARTRKSAHLLHECMTKSTRMKALVYMYDIVKIMWSMELFVRPDEVFLTIKDVSEACLGEEQDEELGRHMDAYTRLQLNIHLPIWHECQDLWARHWNIIRRPRLESLVDIMDESIYRVSAIIAWM